MNNDKRTAEEKMKTEDILKLPNLRDKFKNETNKHWDIWPVQYRNWLEQKLLSSAEHRAVGFAIWTHENNWWYHEQGQRWYPRGSMRAEDGRYSTELFQIYLTSTGQQSKTEEK